MLYLNKHPLRCRTKIRRDIRIVVWSEFYKIVPACLIVRDAIAYRAELTAKRLEGKLGKFSMPGGAGVDATLHSLQGKLSRDARQGCIRRPVRGLTALA